VACIWVKVWRGSSREPLGLRIPMLQVLQVCRDRRSLLINTEYCNWFLLRLRIDISLIFRSLSEYLKRPPLYFHPDLKLVVSRNYPKEAVINHLTWVIHNEAIRSKVAFRKLYIIGRGIELAMDNVNSEILKPHSIKSFGSSKSQIQHFLCAVFLVCKHTCPAFNIRFKEKRYRIKITAHKLSSYFSRAEYFSFKLFNWASRV